MAVSSTTGPSLTTVGSAELFKQWRATRDRQRPRRSDRALPAARAQAGAAVPASNEPYEDLVQVASLGLVKAVERFDPDRGFAFTSFAVPTIVGELKRYFRDTAWALHVDRSAQERARKIADARREISRCAGGRQRWASSRSTWSAAPKRCWTASRPARPTTRFHSMRRGRGGDGPASRIEALGDEDDRLELVDDQATIFAAAQRLPERERQILFLRFGEDLTQTEIAERVGVSQMQVSRLLRKSLQRLRETHRRAPIRGTRRGPSGDADSVSRRPLPRAVDRGALAQ